MNHLFSRSLQAEFSMYNDAKRLLTWSTSQTAEGCCVSAEKEGDVVTDLSLYLKRGVKIKQPLWMKSQLGKSLLTIEGECLCKSISSSDNRAHGMPLG